MPDLTEVVFTRGKHINKTMEDVPSGYLEWVVENWEEGDITEAAEAELKYRTENHSHWN